MDVDNETVGLAQETEVPNLLKQSDFFYVYFITGYALCGQQVYNDGAA